MGTDYFDWQTAYGRYHDHFPGFKPQPVIGITGNFGEKGCELAEGYFESVLKAGATPVIIPPFEDKDALANVLDRVDGLLLSGGGDLNPLFTDRHPDAFGIYISTATDLFDRGELLLRHDDGTLRGYLFREVEFVIEGRDR